jgi:hypothetical protein
LVKKILQRLAKASDFVLAEPPLPAFLDLDGETVIGLLGRQASGRQANQPSSVRRRIGLDCDVRFKLLPQVGPFRGAAGQARKISKA